MKRKFIKFKEHDIKFKKQDKECAICFEIMKPEETKRLPCGHEFHTLCITPWLRKNTGPLCRANIDPAAVADDSSEEEEPEPEPEPVHVAPRVYPASVEQAMAAVRAGVARDEAERAMAENPTAEARAALARAEAEAVQAWDVWGVTNAAMWAEFEQAEAAGRPQTRRQISRGRRRGMRPGYGKRRWMR